MFDYYPNKILNKKYCCLALNVIYFVTNRKKTYTKQKTFPVHNSLNGECHYNYKQI